MKDYYNIAKRYATEHKCDIVQPTTAERDGYHYFFLNHTIRPRYMGHPHIIKISPDGEVQRVYDVDEIYWAVKRIIEPGQ